MAGQISELARDSLPSDYRAMNTGDGRILLVEGGDRVLAAFPPDLSESAVRQLEGLGVTSVVNELVVDIDATGVELKAPDGTTRRVRARTVIGGGRRRGEHRGAPGGGLRGGDRPGRPHDGRARPHAPRPP